MTDKEDPLAKLHRDYRQQCQAWGTYRPLTDEQIKDIDARWRQESARKLAASQAKPRTRSGRRRHGRDASET